MSAILLITYTGLMSCIINSTIKIRIRIFIYSQLDVATGIYLPSQLTVSCINNKRKVVSKNDRQGIVENNIFSRINSSKGDM